MSAASVAHAERKRVVVLDFEGPKGERFHEELIKLLKKTHTVVPTHQWNGTAEQLDAGGTGDKDVRRVAKKLKIDAIVEGRIEKRREAFLIHIKLREGKTGEVVRADIGTKAAGARIDAHAQRDLREELVGAIDEVESNRPGDGDDERSARSASPAEDDEEDDRPVKKRARKRVARAEDDEEGDRPVKKRTNKAEAQDDEDESAAPARKGQGAKPAKKAGHADDSRKVAKTSDEDEDALPPRKASGKAKADDRAGKKIAKKSETRDEDDEDALPPRKATRSDARSFSKRPDDERGTDRVDTRTAKASDDEERAALKPKTDDAPADDDGDEPRKAADAKVASSDDDTRVEAEVEPGSLGAGAAYSPGQRAIELATGASMTVRRMSFAAKDDLVERPAEYKGGRAPGALIDATIYPLALRHRGSGILKDIGVTVSYDRALKVSSRSQLTGMTVDTKETRLGAGLVFRHAFGTAPTAPVVIASIAYSSQVFRIEANLDVPAVHYKMFEPGLGLRFPATANVIFGLDAKFMAITSAGQIQEPSQYGTAKLLGVEGAFAVDFLFGGGLFARAAFRYETIGYTFNGNGAMTFNRDHIGSTQDVTGARDSYLGGQATVGYVY